MLSFESVAESISRDHIFVALPWHIEGKQNGNANQVMSDSDSDGLKIVNNKR